MKTIINNSLDASFWFALEEYVMKTEKFCDEYFLFWNTVPTLMIGRFQNTLQEINADFVRNNNMQVIRRNSGGGTIYTDPATWQFSFITWKQQGEAKDFKEFTKPVIEALQQLGVPAEFNNRNDILAGGKKFSGNAQFSMKDRFLHHGSILFDTNLDNLVLALHVDDEKFISKGIKSVRERVTNIKPFMNNATMSSVDFSLKMRELLASDFEEEILDEHDVLEIEKIRVSKFQSWDWNYGHSPEYNLKKWHRFEGGKVEVQLMVKHGVISHCNIQGDFFSHSDMQMLCDAFAGCRHTPEDVNRVLLHSFHEGSIYKVSREELAGLFF